MCYTEFINKKWKAVSHDETIKQVDTLRELTIAHEDKPHKRYVIEMLAEHADEAEMTEEFLAWLKGVFLIR